MQIVMMFLIAFILAVAFSAGATFARETFYVAPGGKDAWSGRLAEANAAGTDGPLASLERARDAIRELKKAGGLKGPVAVLLREGTYELPQTFALTAEDSGAAEAPVVYGAFPRETVILSGGRRIGGWKAGKANGRDCLTADVPDAAGGWDFHELFVDGRRCPRTRLPGEGFYRFTGAPAMEVKAPWGNQGPRSATFAPGELKAWHNLADVKLVILQRWVEKHMYAESVDEKARQVTFVTSGPGLIDEKGQFARYYVENVLEALERPGQWYLDRPAGKLYYLPRPGQDEATLAAIAPRLPCLLVLEGAEGRCVSHVRFENLQFRHCQWSLPREDPGSYQAASNVPGAVRLLGAENCVLYGCTIAQVGPYALELTKGSRRNAVVACTMTDLGGGGVRIDHDTQRTTVADCRIGDGGKTFHSAVGVWIGNSSHNRVLHNEIHDLYYSGVSCGWSWGYREVGMADNRIEGNHIHDIGKGLLSDMGGIYTLGVQPGTVLRGNVIHDTRKYGYLAGGIYPDEGSSEMLIEGNLTYRTHSAGLNIHYGRDIWIRNNIFATAEEDVLGRGRQEAHRSALFEGNIIYCRAAAKMLRGYSNTPPFGHLDFRRNLYGCLDGAVKFNDMTWEQWRQMGRDREGAVADPQFVDADRGDFRLRPGSPALKMGFAPVDASAAGPRDGADRPWSYDDRPPEKVDPFRFVRTRLEVIRTIGFGPGAAPGRVRLTLTNIGEVPAGGAVEARVMPAGAGDIRGESRLAFALEPGGKTQLEFDVLGAAEAGEIGIETLPSGGAAVPACLYQENFTRRTWRIPRLEAVESVADVPGALASMEPRVLRTAAGELAQVRLAVAGPCLAAHVRVRDGGPVRKDKNWWEGSCVELFTARLDHEARTQVVALPPVGSQEAAVKVLRGRRREAGDAIATVEVRAVEGGYEVLALLPMERLQLDPKAEGFLFQLAATADQGPDKPRAYVPLYETALPCGDHPERYGLMQVGQP